MRLEVLLLNKTKESYLQQGVSDYLHRLRRYVVVELVEIKVKSFPTRTDSEIKAQESSQLDRRATQGSLLVAELAENFGEICLASYGVGEQGGKDRQFHHWRTARPG